MLVKNLKFGWNLGCFEKRSSEKWRKCQVLFIEITQDDI